MLARHVQLQPARGLWRGSVSLQISPESGGAQCCCEDGEAHLFSGSGEARSLAIQRAKVTAQHAPLVGLPHHSRHEHTVDNTAETQPTHPAGWDTQGAAEEGEGATLFQPHLA